MTELLDWLGGLPAPLLYLVIAVAAFVENIFPPAPADTAIALGAFVASRGNGTAIGAWGATMVGNLSGAMLMYALGRRYGSSWLERKLPALGGRDALDRVERSYAAYGVAALAVSRFLPGVRAVVPPLAGALRIGVGKAALAMGLASASWYGLITWFAFSLGLNADALLARIADSQWVFAGVAAVLLAAGGGVWWWRRRSGRE